PAAPELSAVPPGAIVAAPRAAPAPRRHSAARRRPSRTGPRAGASIACRRNPRRGIRARRHGRTTSGRSPQPRRPWSAGNRGPGSPAQCAPRAGQLGAVVQAGPPTGPVSRAPRRRRIPGRRPADLIRAASLRRAAVEVVQLDILVPQGDSGTGRTAAVLGGLAPGLLAGLGQTL